MALTSYMRLQRLLQVYTRRHPEMVDPSKILCLSLDHFSNDCSLALIRHYFGLIARYLCCMKHINLTKQEFDLLFEVLMDLQFEIAWNLSEKRAFHNHNQN